MEKMEFFKKLPFGDLFVVHVEIRTEVANESLNPIGIIVTIRCTPKETSKIPGVFMFNDRVFTNRDHRFVDRGIVRVFYVT